jgi:hypothetical protein
MTPIESIYEIESLCLDLRKYLSSKDVLVVKKARKKYEHLINRFFNENVNFVEPDRRQDCLNNFDYFLKLMKTTGESYYTDNEY